MIPYTKQEKIETFGCRDSKGQVSYLTTYTFAVVDRVKFASEYPNAKVEQKPSNLHGNGLFVTEDVSAGDIIFESLDEQDVFMIWVMLNSTSIFNPSPEEQEKNNVDFKMVEKTYDVRRDLVNCEKSGNKIFTTKDLEKGTELLKVCLRRLLLVPKIYTCD